jgi:hypothetical protein
MLQNHYFFYHSSVGQLGNDKYIERMTKKSLRKGSEPEKHSVSKKNTSQSGGPSRNPGGESDRVDDERFSSLLSAPMFKKTSTEKNKVVLDERFKSILTDEKFRVMPGGSVDQYGRKVKGKSSQEQALKELEGFYTVDKSSLPEEEATTEPATKKKKQPVVKPQNDEDRLDYLNRLARGEVSDSDESEEEDDDENQMDVSGEEEEESEEEDEEEEDILFGKSPLDVPGDEEEVEMGEPTKRISVLNCDWENIKANDLL